MDFSRNDKKRDKSRINYSFMVENKILKQMNRPKSNYLGIKSNSNIFEKNEDNSILLSALLTEYEDKSFSIDPNTSRISPRKQNLLHESIELNTSFRDWKLEEFIEDQKKILPELFMLKKPLIDVNQFFH